MIRALARTFAIAIASLFFVSLVATAQPAASKGNDASKPLPMPADRAADSYQIYSSLIPLGETGGNDWPHAMWLVEDTTITAIPSDQPCEGKPGATHFESSLNPHAAVHPPDNQQQDFNEILADFDRHCHDRIALDPHRWTLSQPVHLLNQQEQKAFRLSRAGEPRDLVAAAKYKGAPALYAFSEVYFNLRHTVALVYATHWCGNLCGQGFWLAFGLKDGKWQPLPWNSTHWIS
jgi:hypothetical protein